MPESRQGLLSVGQVFHDRYEVVRCLKQGGMGAVYECVHLATRKHRALKVMLPQLVAAEGLRERFELETRVTADIESEHIVETFDAGIDEATGAPFLVMELLRGEDLACLLKRRGALPAPEVVLLLSQAAFALDRTHAAGIVHRDLKPENLFVTTRDDGTPRLKILDFGIAKVLAEGGELTQHTATIGTPLYMPREQIRGEGAIGPQADVYALGHIAFALLTGAAYWADERKATPALYAFLWRVLEGASEPATARALRRAVALPPAFDAWFARATAPEAAERFETASALVEELAAVLGLPAPRSSVAPLLPELRPASRSSLPPSRSTSSSFAISQPTIVITGDGAMKRPVEARAGSARRAFTVAAVVAATAIGGLIAFGMGRGGIHGAATAGSAALARAEADARPPEVVSVACPPEEAVAPAATAPPPAPSATALPAWPRRGAPLRAAAPATACDPPYVIDGAGHRRMKQECL
jgi:serine/threonine protein kinase